MDSDFQGRVFPKDTFSVVFSQSRAQDVQALTFTFSPTVTTVTGLESQTWNDNSIFEFGSLNDFSISFTNNSIVFSNTKTESSIAISGGVYEELRFIGFHSDVLTTWIVLESTARLRVHCTVSSHIYISVEPGGIIQISSGEQVAYQEVINVTCTEKQLGRNSNTSRTFSPLLPLQSNPL